MKKVGTNRFVSECWLNQSQEYATNSSRSYYVNEKTLYTLEGRVLASYVNNGIDEDVIFLDNVSSTAKAKTHKHSLSAAISRNTIYNADNSVMRGRKVFFLPINNFSEPYADKAEEIVKKYYLPIISEYALYCKRARERRPTKILMFDTLVEEAKEFCRYFGLNIEIKADRGVSIEDVELMKIAVILGGGHMPRKSRYFHSYGYLTISDHWYYNSCNEISLV